MNATELYRLKKDFIQMVNTLHDLQSVIEKGGGETKESAIYDTKSNICVIRTEVQGTIDGNRSDLIEYLSEGSGIKIVREPNNSYNSNNLSVRNMSNESVGNLSAEIGNNLSPLLDNKIASIKGSKVSYVERKSQRGPRARKANLYVEITVKLEDIKVDEKDCCTVLLLGGDQVRAWAQKLSIIKCNMPVSDAKLLFEIYNFMNNEYEEYESNKDFSYVGLDGLMGEIIDAHNKRMKNAANVNTILKGGRKKPDAQYFIDICLKLAEEYPDRYGRIKKYIENNADRWEVGLNDIFEDNALEAKTYYWLDRTRVDFETYDRETDCGFNHWYEVAELYDKESDIPFDINDEDIACIFGFNKFEDFADLSYGC